MPATDLIISEYIEGSSNNKALELYNGTDEAISLADYRIVIHFNGSLSPGLTINLSGTVAAGDVYVLAHSSSAQAIRDQADATNGAGWFNGDDAVVLERRVEGTTDYAVVDSLGQIGFDPGSQWGTGNASTADNTLTRDPSVISGDTNPYDVFNPADQWVGHPNNEFGNLGSHGAQPPYGITALSADKLEGDSGTTAFTFTVTRADGASAQTIAWSVGSGTGLPADADPADFGGGALPSGTIAFEAGQTSVTLTVQVAGDLLAEIDETFTVTLGVDGSPSAEGRIRNDDVLLIEIAAIQGAGHVSPLDGQLVATTGIVTAITSNGFWIQDPTPDSDNRTSDAIFVFTGSAPAAGVVEGAEVRVSGRVTEYQPLSGGAGLSMTEISVGSSGFVQLTGNSGTIAPTIVGAGGLIPPTESFGDDDDVFDPATQGLDFWESLEGMLVTLNDAVATGPSATSSFGDSETFVRLGGTDAGLLTPNGGLIVQEGDFNPERIAVQEDNRVFDNDYRANVGDSLGDVTGVVNYDSRGSFEVIPTQSFAVTPGGIARETGTDLTADADHLTIASYNAENLAFSNPATKLMEIAEQIVNGLGSPDIIALQEVQDDNGSGRDLVSSELTLQRLVDAINAVAGPDGPNYAWAYVTPENNQDGGQGNGNIRQAFLYNVDRVQLADSTVGGATEAVTVTNDGGVPDLSVSVGRIDPTNDAFDNSRKPLVAEFIFNGESVFVINNHFNSKIGDDPLFGANQPPVEETLAKRLEQAAIVADFVEQLLAIDPDANVAVVGDLNDFGFSNTLGLLEEAGLDNLAELLPENERYDYNFQGNSQELDHILVSGNLGEEAAFDILRINSEFWDQTSDHDPMIASLNIEAGLTSSGGNGEDFLFGGAGNDWIDGGNGADLLEGGNGKDELHGGRGDDALVGGNAADTLFGERGSDMLDGGAGNDLLSGEQGDDRLTGGDGADRFVFAKSGGSDIITDFELGVDSLLFAEGVSVRSYRIADVDLDGVDDMMLYLNGGGNVSLLGITGYSPDLGF